MINYTSVANTTGTFPNVVSQNETTPGALDGTPYIKAVIDDLWGESQARMDHAGMTPNLITEAAGASQRLEAMQRICGHPGEIVAWVGSTSDPSSINIRLLPLIGQGIVKANYADLDTFTYVGDTLNPTAPAFYRATDAAGTSRSTTGTYLILPDLRGYVLRGLDVAASVDPDGASRSLGDTQSWALVNHDHNYGTYASAALDAAVVNSIWHEGTGTTGGLTNLIPGSTNNPFFVKEPQNASTTPATSIAPNAENRMSNSAVHWCIRY